MEPIWLNQVRRTALDSGVHSHRVHRGFIYSNVERTVEQAIHLSYVHDFPYRIDLFVFDFHGSYDRLREVNIGLVGVTKRVQVRGQRLLPALVLSSNWQARCEKRWKQRECKAPRPRQSNINCGLNKRQITRGGKQRS